MERELFTDSKALKLTGLSLGLSVLIFLLKFLAYYITGSVAIYSDAMESIVNIFSALLALIGTKIALKPSDREHPYGHTKVEYLVAILEGLFVLLASFSIIYKAYQSFLHPKSLESLDKGIFLILLASSINALLSLKIYRQGKKEASPILLSHATHLFTDILTTLGVSGGILLATIFKFWFLDPLLAILMGLNILYLGFKVIREAANSLLDVSLCHEKVEDIKKIIKETIAESSIKEADYHNFKSRKAGRQGFVEFHLNVPENTTVKEAHDLCDLIEERVKKAHPEIHLTVHIEPQKKNNTP